MSTFRKVGLARVWAQIPAWQFLALVPTTLILCFDLVPLNAIPLKRVAFGTKAKVSLTPVAQSFKHDFTCNAMRGRKLCKDCWFFPELKQPSAFGTCVACDFLVGLEDAFHRWRKSSFLREMDRLLPGWQDPRGLQRKFLSRTLSNSELGIVADNIAAFVFPAGHKLDVLMNWRDWPNAFRSVQCTAALGAMKQVVRCIDFHCELRPSFVEPTPNKFTYTVYPFLRV